MQHGPEVRVIQVHADSLEACEERADMLRLTMYGPKTAMTRAYSWITDRGGMQEVEARYSVSDATLGTEIDLAGFLGLIEPIDDDPPDEPDPEGLPA